MKIRPLRAESFHADGRTYTTKPIVAFFSYFASLLKKNAHKCYRNLCLTWSLPSVGKGRELQMSGVCGVVCVVCMERAQKQLHEHRGEFTFHTIKVRGTGQLKCDDLCAETRFRLSAKGTSPFKSAGGVSSVDCWQPRCAHQR